MSDDNIVFENSAKAEKAEKAEKVKPEVSGQQSGVGRTEPYIQTPRLTRQTERPVFSRLKTQVKDKNFWVRTARDFVARAKKGGAPFDGRNS